MDIFHEPNASFSIASPLGTVLVNPLEGFQVNEPKDGVLIWAYTCEGQQQSPTFGVSTSPPSVQVINDPGEYGMGEIGVRGYPNPSSDDDDSDPLDIVYGIDIQDVRLCVIGSIGTIPTGRTSEDIGSSQVVLVDTNLSRLGGGDLARLVRAIEPKVTIACGDYAERLAAELAIKEVQQTHKVTLSARSFSDEKMPFYLLSEKN